MVSPEIAHQGDDQVPMHQNGARYGLQLQRGVPVNLPFGQVDAENPVASHRVNLSILDAGCGGGGPN